MTDIPDLSKPTNLEYLELRDCIRLVMLPCSIWNCHMLKELDMSGCTSLEVLPTDVNLVSLEKLFLSYCSRLRTFPQISTNIKKLDLYQTAIEEVPSWVENMSKLQELDMSFSNRLKNISASIFKLRHLKKANFSHCEELTSFSDASVDARIPDFRDFQSDNLKDFRFDYCMNLDRNAQEFIVRLSLPMMITVLPGKEVPMYFTHRTCGSSLIIKLPQSCPSHKVLRFKACIVVGSVFNGVKVCSRFRGLKGVKLFYPWHHDIEFEITDHLVVYGMEFQFLLVDIDGRYEIDKIDELDEIEGWGLTERGLKECGLKDVYPSPYAAATRISEI